MLLPYHGVLKIVVYLLFFFFLPFSLSAQDKFAAKDLKSKQAFSCLCGEESPVSVDLLVGKKDRPVYYTVHLMADVCSDGLCKPINVDVFWDLLGNFVDYQTPKDSVLTKFDHVEFTNEDHKKLHEILSDTSSLLRDYRVEDMIDPQIKLFSTKVDAVTGATNKTFEGAIVGGAVYTVYTLWHFVNGEIRTKLLDHTKAMLTDPLILQMLNSNNNQYQYFIFNYLPTEKLKEFTPDIIKLIGDTDEFVPHFAISALPEKVWTTPAYQVSILHYFNKTNIAVQNALLFKFRSRQLDKTSLEILIDNIPKLSRIQIEKVFQILENNRGHIEGNLAKKINALANSPVAAISQQATDLLMKLKK